MSHIPPNLSRWMPANHEEVSRRPIRVDGESAELTRYERRDGRNRGLGGEHFSTVIASDGTLKGFAHLSLDLAGKPLPSRERSAQIARDFLQEAAPDLLPRMEVHWIAPHDEPIRVAHDDNCGVMDKTGAFFETWDSNGQNGCF